MTDYEKDLQNWEADSSYYPTDKPNRDAYDKYGYRKGTVTYEDGKVLDNYLIQNYGIEYARQHFLKRI